MVLLSDFLISYSLPALLNQKAPRVPAAWKVCMEDYEKVICSMLISTRPFWSSSRGRIQMETRCKIRICRCP